MTDGFITVGGLRVYHQVHGTEHAGRPVLNITGTGNDLRVSRPDRHPLNRHFRTVHYDQRGLGQTSKPIEQWTMNDHADDAAGVLDALGIDRAHVVGTSFGGMVAQHMAIRHPDRIDRLVLACTSAGGVGQPSADLLALADMPPEQAAPIRLRLMDTRWNSIDDVDEVLRPWFVERAKRRDELDADATRGARMQLVARSHHDAWDGIADVAIETLVIGGRYDATAPPENLERIAERMPNATVEFFEGGHLFFIQDSAAWPRVVSFLR